MILDPYKTKKGRSGFWRIKTPRFSEINTRSGTEEKRALDIPKDVQSAGVPVNIKIKK